MIRWFFVFLGGGAWFRFLPGIMKTTAFGPTITCNGGTTSYPNKEHRCHEFSRKLTRSPIFHHGRRDLFTVMCVNNVYEECVWDLGSSFDWCDFCTLLYDTGRRISWIAKMRKRGARCTMSTMGSPRIDELVTWVESRLVWNFLKLKRRKFSAQPKCLNWIDIFFNCFGMII